MDTQLIADSDRPTASRTRSLRIAAIAVGLVVLALLALLGGLRAARGGGALPGVVVGSVEVGGLQGQTLRDAIASAGVGERTVTARRGEASVSSPGRELGYLLDIDATETAVLRRGRQLNPIAALADQLRAFGGQIHVEPIQDIDTARLDAWATDAAERLSAEPVEGDLSISGATVTRVDPQPGWEVAAADVRDKALAAMVDGGELSFEVPANELSPETAADDVAAVYGLAERAVSGPVELTRETGSLTLSAEQIGDLLRVEREDGDLHLRIDHMALRAAVPAPQRAAFETEPVDAQITIANGVVSISESRDGFRFDAEVAAAQLLEIATGDGERTAELDGEVIAPDLSTAEAEALEVVEQVSSFTTEYPCCQSRVQNIHRIAELVDGVLIKPGETFSVNDHVGRRTRERGFTDGGAIQAGEFVQEVGGGVSQFATTMYNAAFFGGYAIPDFKAHSYYISRYPVGREATLNYPNVDLKVRNNSPHGLVIKTSVTSTSVTVAFWGKTWVEVSDITGERRNITAPPTQVRENPGMRAGTERVVQSGRNGFDITVIRVLRFPDGREERETINTRYLPEPRIVERGTASPAPQPPEQPPEPGNGGEQPPPEQPPPPPENGGGGNGNGGGGDNGG